MPASPQAETAIRMVISDVDGTLVNAQKELTERNKQAVSQLRDAGIQFTLVSSRPPYGLTSLIRDLQLDQPVMAFSGGTLASPEGKSLQTYFLPEDLIPNMLDCLARYQLSPRLYTADRWLIQNTDQPHAQDETRTIETEPTIVSDFTPYFPHALKLTGVSDDPAAVRDGQQALQKLLGGRASVLCSQPYYLDITHRLANKGHAVATLAQSRGIPQSNIAVIGDMPTDVPMFGEAGLSIAMGNASDEVKREADYVTENNDQDGFAKAMTRFILNRQATAATRS